MFNVVQQLTAKGSRIRLLCRPRARVLLPRSGRLRGGDLSTEEEIPQQKRFGFQLFAHSVYRYYKVPQVPGTGTQWYRYHGLLYKVYTVSVRVL